MNTFLYRFLLDYRNSKHCTTGDSPAKIMFNRELKTRCSLLKPPTTRKKIIQSQEKQINNFKGKREIEFKIGQKVYARDYRNPNKEQWQKAIIKKCIGPRNYTCVLTENDRLIKRHIDQLRVSHDQNDHQSNVSENTGSAESNSFTNSHDSIGADDNGDLNAKESAVNVSLDASDDSFHDASTADVPTDAYSVREESLSDMRPVRSSALQALTRLDELRANRQI